MKQFTHAKCMVVTTSKVVLFTPVRYYRHEFFLVFIVGEDFVPVIPTWLLVRNFKLFLQFESPKGFLLLLFTQEDIFR